MSTLLHTFLAGAAVLLASFSAFSQSTNCKPIVNVENATFCKGDSTRLRADTLPNTTYRWYRDTTSIVGAGTSSIFVRQSGAYRLEATRREEKWAWDMAGGPESDLNDIQFVGTTGWIVGNYGTLLRTTNGATWDTILTNRPENFGTVYFLNTQKGWIGGSDGLLLTSSDGGTSWNSLTLPITGLVQKIRFFDENIGYVQADRKLFKTLDGGKTWTELALPENANLIDFAFVDAGMGWIAHSNQVYKTENGGASWVLQYTVTDFCTSIENIRALDANTCWVEFTNCSQRTNFPTVVVRTTDGGNTWTEHGISIPANFPSLSTFSVTDLLFMDAQTGYALGRLYRRVFAMYGVSGGAVFKTVDGGKNWRLIHENVNNGYPIAMAFASPSQGVIVGGQGLVWQVSGPDSIYSSYANRTFLPLYSVGGTSQRIFAVGGTPRRTENGVHPDSKAVTMTLEIGEVWTKKESQISVFGTLQSSGYTVRQIKFKNDQFGWKVGFGILATTQDGGQTWVSLYGNTQPPTSFIEKAYFQTDDSGYYLASDPVYGGASLYRFTGASSTVVPVSYKDTPDINTGTLDLQFINNTMGFISTSNGKLIKTTDGGATWTVQTVRTGKRLQRVFFMDEQTGWVISSDGLILKTQNGGQTWTEQSSGVTTSLNGIYFTSTQTGYVVGAGGLVLKTTNGGTDWKDLPASTRSTLRDVFMVSANSGWAVGDNGVILRLENNDCQSFSDPVVITAKPLPAKPTISASGDMKLVSSAGAGNQWYLNGTAITGATATEYNPTQAGRYTVLVTLDGCSSALSEGFEYVITATDPTLIASMTLYPNPSPDQLFVSLKNINGPFELELLSSEGRLLATHHGTSPSQESILPLELKGLAPGTYIVRVRSGTFTKSSKVILNR